MDRKPVLWVIGDSTLSSFTDNYYYPRYGYGTRLSAYLDDNIEVRNIALSGRSSKSYTAEPQYSELISGMQPGDFLLIGFGHNDEKTEAARYTCAEGDFKAEGSFAHSLYTNYIVPANKAKTTVILCTPIVRRTPTGIWSSSDLHVTEAAGEYKGGDYAQAVRQLGEQLNILVVDMTKMTKNLYDSIGVSETKYLHAWPSNKELSVDNTHTNIWGARVNAYLVLNEVKRAWLTGLAEHIIGVSGSELEFAANNDNPSDTFKEVLNKEKYLVSNPEYKPVVYNSDLAKSEFWEEACGFSGTVFGDVLEEPNKIHFVLEKAENNGVHIAVLENCGKISMVTDGIAMYYKKIPIDQPFILKAKAHVLDYFLNDQVSFGLMVRDDMYIDMQTPDGLGDYVAAGPLMLTHGSEAWNCFARKSGVLVKGGLCRREYKPGEIVDLQIESTADGYACTFGEEQTITGGFDFKLAAVDPEYVYAGMFAARNADVIFTDIELIYK